jgi:hypothetical protein
MHLDVMVDDRETAGEAVLALGARRLPGDHLYADPAGHVGGGRIRRDMDSWIRYGIRLLRSSMPPPAARRNGSQTR